MARNVKTDDGFSAATMVYERLKAAYVAYAEEGEREHVVAANAKAEADEQRKAERRRNLELATIILRYGLDPDSEWSDVLDELRKKDQRLDLAVAMLQVRGDWSEGPDAVSSALDRFRVETDEDKSIANDVLGCMNPWDGDGRVFRDTTWSYSRLFAAAADQQLSADIQLARERTA